MNLSSARRSLSAVRQADRDTTGFCDAPRRGWNCPSSHHKRPEPSETMTAPTRAAATAFVLAAQTALAGCSMSPPPPAPSPIAAVPETRATPLSDTVEPQAVLRAMTTVADWQLANPSAHKPYEWQEAPFWAGLYEVALRSSGRQRYLDGLRRNGESIQWQPGARPPLADDHPVTQSYLFLYRLEHDRRMIEPALARFDEMVLAPYH